MGDEHFDSTGPYASRTVVPALSECYFYHSMDLPGVGTVEGEWDLREGVDAYLGHESVSGRRVLELGTASGFLCFEMERRGADVIAYDLAPTGHWDIVPFASIDLPAIATSRAEHIARINNSWWLSRSALKAKARMVYGSVYDIPATIGHIDVCTFGAILLHLRDPLRALQSAAALHPETIIITEMLRQHRFGFFPERRSQLRSPLFLPNAATSKPFETWWSHSPESTSNLLGIVGYKTLRIIRHKQQYHQDSVRMFTIVSRRA